MIRQPFFSGKNNRYRRWSRGVAWLLASVEGSLVGALFVLTHTNFSMQLPPTPSQLLLWLAGGESLGSSPVDSKQHSSQSLCRAGTVG